MKSKILGFPRGAFLLAGVTALGYVGARTFLGLWPRANARFFNWTGPISKGVQAGSARIDLPVKYYREDSFMALFPAAYEPTQALLPSQDLHPVKLPGGRAVVMVISFCYLNTTLGPYGEVGVVIPCTYRCQSLPLLPLLLEGRFPSWGGYVLHLPVTSKVARDAGRGIWGYPKFVADMDFVKCPEYQRVKLSEGDAHILTLTVQQSGVVIKDNRPLISYSVLEGKLIRTTIPSRSVYQFRVMPNFQALSLGNHPIADQLRSLEISTTAIATRNNLTRAAILPVGEEFGQADHYDGYPGKDRDYGRFTITYDDTGETIDMNSTTRAYFSLTE